MDKKGFTLVEILVVVTIVSILWTIAFVSFSHYSASARDAVRKTDIANIHKGLEMYQLEAIRVPLPENKVDITADAQVVRYQGFAWATVLERAKIWKIWQWGARDPMSFDYYSYIVDTSQTKFEIVGFIETPDLVFQPISQVHAFQGFDNFFTAWKDMGILFVEDTPINFTDEETVDIKNTTSQYTFKFTSYDTLTGTWILLASSIAMRDKAYANIDDSLIGMYDMSTKLNGDIHRLKDFSKYGNHATMTWSYTMEDGVLKDLSSFVSTIGRTAAIDTPITINHWSGSYTYETTIKANPAYSQVVFSSLWSNNFLARVLNTNYDFAGSWKSWANFTWLSSETMEKQWIHYVLVTNSDWNTKLYIDGVLWNSVDIWSFSDTEFQLRMMNATQNCYLCGTDGSLDMMETTRVYNRELTDAEIQTLYLLSRAN